MILEADSIPFTQFLLPHGRRRQEYITRPANIVADAQRFIAAGGWYECEVLTTGQVSLTACMNVDGEPQDIEFQFSANGPEIPAAVDRLVAASLKHIGASK